MARRADRAVGTVWSAPDLGWLRIPVASLALGDGDRNPLQRELRLGEQFIHANRSTFNIYGVTANLEPMQEGVSVALHTSNEIGACALISPSTGRHDFGLVIRPRFGWRGVGALMADVGAKIMPDMPRLPALPRSEHEVPRWVLAAIVLARLEALLADPKRKFLLTRAEVDRPRGKIYWNEYVTKFISKNTPQRVPCEFSELRADSAILSTVHAAILAQLHSLQRVKADSFLVNKILARYEKLRQVVAMFAPSWSALSRLQLSLNSVVLAEAIEAMAWTYDERGLAGRANFSGLPWRLSMAQVFEARVESLALVISRRFGGMVRTGRLRETQRALRWDPPYTGSQRTLLPDVEIIRGGETLIFDAKYKSHWEELTSGEWRSADELVRDAHRHDLLQVLAYGASTSAESITCVLVYPCTVDTWLSLRKRGRLVHRASVPAGDRKITLMLAAIPFEQSLDEIASAFISTFEANQF